MDVSDGDGTALVLINVVGSKVLDICSLINDDGGGGEALFVLASSKDATDE